MNTAFYEEDLTALKIEIDINDRPLQIDDKEHLNVVKRLCDFYQGLTKDQKLATVEYPPAGEWKNYNDEKSFFYQTLLDNDYEKAGDYLKNFWRNPLGLIVKEYAKFQDFEENNLPVTSAFQRSMARNFVIWKDMFKSATVELKIDKNVGNPWGCSVDDVLVTPKAIRFHTNAMQIKTLLRDCPTETVAEIGGGYGALASYLLRNTENLQYFNIDLPETLVLAAYHLVLNFPDKKIYLYGEQNFEKRIYEDYEVVLLPNYMIEEIPTKSIDVFFNSFSLSEMPSNTLKSYIEQIHRLTKQYFLHNNMDRQGVVNRGFERIPSSSYPIKDHQFTLLSKNYDLFHSHFGDYKEFLYKVKS